MTTKYEPCQECEKPVRVDRSHWRVHVEDAGQDLGWYAIGPECRKAHPEAERFGPLGSGER